MRRLVVILVVVAVVAGLVILAGGERGEAGSGTGVLRRPESQAAAPTFGSGEIAVSRPDDVHDLTPVSASPTAAVAQPDDHALTITVLHADGIPAVGGLVVVAPMLGKPWRATTDASGSVAGPATEPEAMLWIDGPLLAPASYALSILRGALTIRLPAGEVLEGHVLVDGAPPQSPFALGLAPRGELTDLPQDIEMLLGRPDLGDAAIDDRPGLLVRQDGGFRFSGLPAGWSGTFSLPGNMVLEAGDDGVALAGDRARTLRLHREPRIHVRFLLPTGEPAARAHVKASTSAESGRNTYALTADDDGRTDFPINLGEPIQTVELAAVAAAGDARADLMRPIEDPVHDVDLGDVRLEPAWLLRFRALEPQGTPIAGAVGGTECPQLVQSEPSGADGLGQLAGVAAGCPELRVGAPRHELASVALPAALPDARIDVVLTPCAHLEVQVVPADGHPRPGLFVSFHTATRGSRWEKPSDFDNAAQLLGTTNSPRASYTTRSGPGASKDVEMRRDYSVPDTGPIVVGCVDPDDPLDLQLVDATRYVLWASKAFTLRPAEQSVVTIPVSAVPSSLVVLVTDESGAPLKDAGVRVFASGTLSEVDRLHVSSVETGADGQCTFENLYTPTVDIECSRPGSADTKLTAVAAAGVVHVLLPTGLTVTVHVVDELGRPVPVPNVWVRRVDGQPLQRSVTRLDEIRGKSVLTAGWTFHDLPGVELIFYTSISGQSFRVTHDPHVPEARLVLPATGSLVVRGLRTDHYDPNVFLQLQRADGARGSDQEWPDRRDWAAGFFRWPVALAGAYRITLVRDEKDPVDDTVLSGPVEATVRAGEETTADLP